MTGPQAAVEIAGAGFGTLLNICGLWIIAWYRVKKPKGEKWKVTTAREFVGKYWVEIIVTIVIVPQWPDVIRSAFKIFAGA